MTESAHPFAVVIVAHREYATLEVCLRGFYAAVSNPVDLIFVDNGSNGALSNCVERSAPGATVITLLENRYFCGGYNAGIQWAIDRNYDYVLIVNADTEIVNPGFIGALIETMEQHKRAAFIGPLVYYRHTGTVQTTCLHFPSILYSLVVWLPFRIVPRLILRQPNTQCDVEFLNGVCVLCRIDALRNIGLMDETFQAYVEDADWAWRARTNGWSSLFVPVPSIIHHEEPYGYEHYSHKTFLLRRNTVHWFLKAGKTWSARVYVALSLLLAHLRLVRARNLKERNAYRQHAEDLTTAYRELLSSPVPLGYTCAKLNPRSIPTIDSDKSN